MKTALKLSSMMGLAVFFFFSCQSAKGGFSSGSKTELDDILRGYYQNRGGVNFSIATNQPQQEPVNISPGATWATGVLNSIPPAPGTDIATGLTLRSAPSGTERYWSSRTHDCNGEVGQPFSPAQTDLIALEIFISSGGAVQITLIKQESDGSITRFPVEIYGYLRGAERGHMVYGRYGGFNGLIAISLWNRIVIPDRN